MDRERIDEIARQAAFVAWTYDRRRTWADWSLSARDDFWSIAQDNLDIPEDERIEMPLDVDPEPYRPGNDPLGSLLASLADISDRFRF